MLFTAGREVPVMERACWWHQEDDGLGIKKQGLQAVDSHSEARRRQLSKHAFKFVLLVLFLVHVSESFSPPQAPISLSSALKYKLDGAEISCKIEACVAETPDVFVEQDVSQFPHSDIQLKSIESNAPAVLLKSGPGTGKSYALASRIAFLIRTGACPPEHIVVLSFTNRDAAALKRRALDMLYLSHPQKAQTSLNMTKQEMSQRIWSGTIHSFAISLFRVYSRGRRVRVLSSKEMRMRVDKCLVNMLANKSFARPNNRQSPNKLSAFRLVYRDALGDVRQSRGMLLHQVCRSLELWKEAGLLPPPVTQQDEASLSTSNKDETQLQVLRDDCIEVTMRLGIPQSVALLALNIFPEYQALHASLGTADPSDLASMTHNLLLSKKESLNALRTKLQHVILDEYQDVSVTQHALLRLLVRGFVDEKEIGHSQSSRNLPRVPLTPPVLPLSIPSAKKHAGDFSFDIPRLFCAGDSNQSIYGWRGAAPSLSVEGFRCDYPQGIVVPLDTSYRLPRDIWNAASALASPEPSKKSMSESHNVNTFPTSPVAERRINEVVGSSTFGQTLPELLSSQSFLEEQVSTVHVQGLWDAREEAKFIASKIWKRSKARVDRCKEALKGVTSENSPEEDLADLMSDPSDVAIMVRSNPQMKLIKEALVNVGVPFVTAEGDESVLSRQQQSLSKKETKKPPMKPVVLMTMHRAKGEEFDDVYLAGWTEGVFPHPTAVSTNRVHEERRLAYVALTRARQKVTITHSFVRRDLHLGPDLKTKHVTTQVEPSRFLYELVSDPSGKTRTRGSVTTKSTSRDGVPAIVWDRSSGSKEFVAGRDLPDYFSKSYEAPPRFRHPYAAQSHRSQNSDETREKTKSMDTAKGSPDVNTVRRAKEDSQEVEVRVLSVGDKLKSREERVAQRMTLQHDASIPSNFRKPTFGITLKGKPCKICIKANRFCKRHAHQEFKDK